MLAWSWMAFAPVLFGADPAGALPADPFARFALPPAWQARFWDSEDARALRDLTPRQVADLVPVQSGLCHVRCPSCEPSTGEDSLRWSPARPDVLTCRLCQATFPNDQVPAKVDGKVPEEVVEVAPRRLHHYPYHPVPPDHQRFADERLYLAAKKDHERREFLAKTALYAAIRHRDRKAEGGDPQAATIAAVILVRFAQVYPDYATHFDPPDQPPLLGPADPGPTLRPGFAIGKWDSSGARDVPLNLVVAYSALRDDPALVEAGQLLNEPDPKRAIEENFLRKTAEFVDRRPFEATESGLLACRGVLAVGRALNDPGLMHRGVARLESLMTRGFYHDGFWHAGDPSSHRRVLDQIDGWLDLLLTGYSDPPGFHPPDGSRRFETLAGSKSLAMIGPIRSASPTIGPKGTSEEAQLASWPAPPRTSPPRRPSLLGGAGIARLGVGSGEDALDVDLMGLGDGGPIPPGRLGLKLTVGGRTVLDDLDGTSPATEWGFERASASRNTMLVDGLNQRETLDEARKPAPGADVLFFAADPDFQVVVMEDRFAYPRSTSRYRETLVVCSGGRTRFAVSVFEVRGGLQHEELFHGCPEPAARWRPTVPLDAGPTSLLPPKFVLVPTARPEDGRWFLQAMGGFTDLSSGRAERPFQAELQGEGPPGVRLHVLNEFATTLYVGASPGSSGLKRSSLVLRRRSEDGASLSSAFVTVFEPIGTSAPLRRVGRVELRGGCRGPGGGDGRRPGDAGREPQRRTLATGQPGGWAAPEDRRGRRPAPNRRDHPGRRHVRRGRRPKGRADPGRRQHRGRGPIRIEGRPGLVFHSGGAPRSRFAGRAGPPDPPRRRHRPGLDDRFGPEPRRGRRRIVVREPPGFHIDARTGSAQYDSFPGFTVPGPHRFGISRIARSPGAALR